MDAPAVLHAPLELQFDYTRSLGPTLSQFMTGLKHRQLFAGRLSDGSLAVPPPEFDPVTHAAVTDLRPVADTGTVQSWTWVPEPVAGQPLDRPFAFAHVLIDGTDRPLLHAVAVDTPTSISTGMRVRAVWADEPVGAITDIRWFVPEDSAPRTSPLPISEDAVTGIVTPIGLAYDYSASEQESKFFRGLAEGKLVGQRCPKCQKVYVPPRGACPTDGVPTTEEVEVADTGTVTTFCIVNVPFAGQRITPPYVSAYVLLDGADIAFLHLILGIKASQVRMGMRVRAVWKPEDEWGTTIENISHFEPSGEPDADFESYKVHL
ncbi:MAG TPA: OB-fold domain-containing protein [Aeromicrobium sp.]|nr:OB-fold domain-containing protein [Aeromicrobium sp.]